MNSQCEKISIEIKDKDYKLLEENRARALERNLIINNIDGEYVPATFEYQGKKIKIKLRLKGHMTDHLQENKWSFRIKIEDNNSFCGMKKFSIQHPGTRGYIYEWIYHELMKQEDIIALRYKFIDVSVNGRDWGIYAVEENFDKALIENNNRKKAPILRFNPDLYWVDRYNELLHIKPINEFSSYYSANFEAFDEKNVLADSIQKKYYLKAIALVDGLRRKKLSVEQVFDIDRMARFHAITDLVGGEHSIDWSDTKYYYNPITEKFEPISYESFSDFPIRTLSGSCRYVELDSLNENYDEWHTALFSNPVFFSAYIRQLERISEPNYLSVFFKSIDKELNNNLSILNKEFPYKKFNKNTYFRNQLMIKKILSPPQTFQAYFKGKENGLIHLQLGGIESLPTEIKSISIGRVNCMVNKRTIIPSKPKSDFVKFKDVFFSMPDSLKWNDSMKSSIMVNYSILGASVLKQTPAFPYTHTDEEFVREDLRDERGNMNEFQFLEVDENSKTILFKDKKVVITRDLIIPKGYSVYSTSGLVIDIKNHAKIITHSPFYFKGQEDEAIQIGTSDSTGQGIEFINSQTSIFENIIFSGFSKIEDRLWERKAAITLYESKVDFKDCSFVNIHSQNVINFIRANFKLKFCSFLNIDNTILKIEYSEGEIMNTVFEKCKFNAIDILQSKLKLNSVSLFDMKNVALFCRGGAQVICNDLKIVNSEIAIVGLNSSDLNFNLVSISNASYGIVAFKNKHGYGSPRISIKNVELKSVKNNYLIETNSSIVVNGGEVKDYKDNVEERVKEFCK
ncbi:MAG: CotH kinase family protein [Bacteroidota bacterium]